MIQLKDKKYTYKKARIIIREMAENFTFEMMDKGVKIKQISVWIGYDKLTFDKSNPAFEKLQHSLQHQPLYADQFGKLIPAPVHGHINFDEFTNSITVIAEACDYIFSRIANPLFLIRRINLGAGEIVSETEAEEMEQPELDFFDKSDIKKFFEREHSLQHSVLELKHRSSPTHPQMTEIYLFVVM